MPLIPHKQTDLISANSRQKRLREAHFADIPFVQVDLSHSRLTEITPRGVLL
jgi:hypothetical protein